MTVRPHRKAIQPSVSHQSPQTLGPFSGVAQDGPARKTRPVALAEELVSRGCSFIEKGIWDEAEKEFRKALKMAADYPEAYNNLGLALLYDGRPAEAYAALQEAVRRLPGWHAAEANLALALQQLERHTEAVTYYRQSLTHKSQQPQIYLSLGDALNAAGKTDEALAAYNNALDTLHNYALAHFRIGAIHARRGKMSEAETALLHAYELDSSNAEAAALLGAIAARRGNIKTAKEWFAKVNADPAPAAAQRGRQRIALFEAAARKGLKEWKASQPGGHKLALCYYDLGLALTESGNDTEALAMFQRASQHDPNWIAPQIFIAYFAALQGNGTAAKIAFESAAAMEPDNGVIAEQLGYLALGMGATREADAQFKRAQSLGRVLPPEVWEDEKRDK